MARAASSTTSSKKPPTSTLTHHPLPDPKSHPALHKTPSEMSMPRLPQGFREWKRRRPQECQRQPVDKRVYAFKQYTGSPKGYMIGNVIHGTLSMMMWQCTQPTFPAHHPFR
eukprot:TRINITY_DN20599_c0_g1_i1.p3 TRINITY_DN20599_c0_g1~~TRINITY_DN20599_c0_g1_i1.p3  ORF type:complete len:112 (+),score=7.40 TRINITY_DN20599_c0_g1_i1:216-551(+)